MLLLNLAVGIASKRGSTDAFKNKLKIMTFLNVIRKIALGLVKIYTYNYSVFA